MSNYCVLDNGERLSGNPPYIKVHGNFNYYVCIDLKRKPGTTNSSITIDCFSKEDRRIAIASKYKWFQTSKGSPNRPLNITTNFYQISPRGKRN